MLRDNKFSSNFSFSCVVRDISAYFKFLKNAGVESPDISLKSEKIIKNLHIANKPVSKKELLNRVEQQALKILSCLSLYGSGDFSARLFFIVSCKKDTISCATASDKQRETGKFAEDRLTELPQGEGGFPGGGFSPGEFYRPGMYQGDAGKLFLKIVEAMHLSMDAVYTSCIAVPEGQALQDYLYNGHDAEADSGLEPLKKSNILTKKKIEREMDLCLGLIKEQIEIIKPEVICCLGDIAARAFLYNSHEADADLFLDTLKQPNVIEKHVSGMHDSKIAMAKEIFYIKDQLVPALRGKFYNYRGIKVMATFAPDLLLTEPAKKRDVWDDMQKIMAVLGI